MNLPLTSTQSKLQQGKKVCIFGKTGAGKTQLAATAKNCVIMNFEGATQCLSDQNLPMIEPQYLNCYNATIYYFNELSKQTYFDTIIIDSYSRMTTNWFEEFKPLNKDLRLVYTNLIEKVKYFSSLIRDCPKNVVLLAHDISAADETGKRYPVFNVAGWAKASMQMMDNQEVFNLGYCDLVARLVTKKENDKLVRFLQTEHEPENGYYCRDKTGKLLPQEEANLDLIFNKMKGL